MDMDIGLLEPAAASIPELNRRGFLTMLSAAWALSRITLAEAGPVGSIGRPRWAVAR